ncbi:1-acyl-sn-glycerol-3-phosphate acyltransferase [Tundrisphaera sp. TA3]|uniref:1-acyl-sn-glycerol-3-phosphate acyltransferase n=1 Tax=Tundrisphaera sp. TA3 TaxID=3435775 RepID=UPI003EBF74F1
MRRLPPDDPAAGEIAPPSFGRAAGWLARAYNRRILRREQGIAAVELSGAEHLAAIRARGDGVLIAPNHPDQADPYVAFEVAARCGGGFAYMAAVQLFQGNARSVLPRIGGFPIDRDGTDLKAFKTAVDLLARGRPVVVFPEGEVYHLSDRITPIREGAAAMAVTAAKRLSAAGKSTYVLPVATKYRFCDEDAQVGSLYARIGTLEALARADRVAGHGLVDRIYDLAETQVALKEAEHLGSPGSGPIPARIAAVREAILGRIEDRRAGRRRADPAPIRVKELRRCCLDDLARPDLAPEAEQQARRDLDDLHVALQLFSYPGDYVRTLPSIDRIAETIRKFEEDLMGDDAPPPSGPRRAIVHIGDPIDVTRLIAEAGKPRDAIGPITAELESRIQGLLDAIGPGTPFRDPHP